MMRRSRIRKAVISLQREKSSTKVSSKLLAKQMTHAVSTADKYYNVNVDLAEKCMVADFISELTKPGEAEKGAVEEKAMEAEEREVEEEVEAELEGGTVEEEAELEGGAVDEEKAELEGGAVEEEAELEGGAVEEEGLKIEQKKELLKIFAKQLGNGVTPQRHHIQVKWSRSFILRNLNVEDAFKYLQRKVNSDLSGAEKVVNWVKTEGRKITNFETSSTASSMGRRYFTEHQASIVAEATSTLKDNANVSEIVNAITKDKQYQEKDILSSFSRQQLRDKFRNIRKKANKLVKWY